MNAKKDLKPIVKKLLKGKKTNVLYINEKEKYSKERFVYVSKGYDFLENIAAVRVFVQKKYDVNWNTLELLLKLMGYKVFTRLMFSQTPRNFTDSRWNSFKEKGLVNVVADHEDVEKVLYSLNTKGRKIVISFYEYLSGEKKIPEDAKNNPLADSDRQVAYDKRKLELIKQMNKLEVPEHIKFLYE